MWQRRAVSVLVLSRLAHGDTSGRAPTLLQVLLTLRDMIDASAHSVDVLAVQSAIIHLLRTSSEIPYAEDDSLGRSGVHTVLAAETTPCMSGGRTHDRDRTAC